MQTQIRTTVKWMLWIIVSFFLVGCAGYGRLKHDDQVTQLFASGKLPQDYTYYYTGRSHIPYAVIGVSPDYRHASRLWDRVELNSKEFSHMIDNIWQPFGTYETRGAYILDDQGDPVGIWWAKYYYTTIKIKPENEIEVYSPYIPRRVGD